MASLYCCKRRPGRSSRSLGSSRSLYASKAALNRRSGCLSMLPAAAPRLALSDLAFTSSMASNASSRFVAFRAAICISISSSASRLTPLPPPPDLPPPLPDEALPGVLASSSCFRRSSSAFLRAFSAAFSLRESAAVLPRAPCCHLRSSSASAAAAASSAFRSAASALRARPATALGFTGVTTSIRTFWCHRDWVANSPRSHSIDRPCTRLAWQEKNSPRFPS